MSSFQYLAGIRAICLWPVGLSKIAIMKGGNVQFTLHLTFVIHRLWSISDALAKDRIDIDRNQESTAVPLGGVSYFQNNLHYRDVRRRQLMGGLAHSFSAPTMSRLLAHGWRVAGEL